MILTLFVSFVFSVTLPEVEAAYVNPSKGSIGVDDDFVYGDLNGDHLVNSIDFAYMRQYLLGIISYFPDPNGKALSAGDVNGDNKINAIDFAYMRQYLLGIISEFPAAANNNTPVPSNTPVPTATPVPTTYRAANTVISLEAYNNPGYFLRHYEYICSFAQNPAPIYDTYFIERNGLADSNAVSFESVNFPGYYLRHKEYKLFIEKNDGSALFKSDSTFRKVSGLAEPSCISYQSYNIPDMYIRNVNSACQLATVSTSSDRSSATFKVAVENETFNNPRTTSVEMPDPWVYKHTDGYYYGMHTVMRNGAYIPQLIMYKSTSLSDLFTKGTSKIIWSAPSTGWNNKDIWAPELYYINNTWYIYYSANFRFGVLSNKSADPMNGTWTDHGRLSPDVWAIDATILRQNGNMYMMWSGQNGGQCINITRMSSPTSLTGSTVTISKPTYNWETVDLKVNEGPEIIQKNGKTYCIYSASHCATQYYCLGMLTIPDTADPMVASNWKKSANPVFQASPEDGLYGTGHNCFTKSKDGTEDWIVYHGTIEAANEYRTRFTCMQQFSWNSDGTPNFGRPCGRKIAIPKPSGE